MLGFTLRYRTNCVIRYRIDGGNHRYLLDRYYVPFSVQPTAWTEFPSDAYVFDDWSVAWQCLADDVINVPVGKHTDDCIDSTIEIVYLRMDGIPQSTWRDAGHPCSLQAVRVYAQSKVTNKRTGKPRKIAVHIVFYGRWEGYKVVPNNTMKPCSAHMRNYVETVGDLSRSCMHK